MKITNCNNILTRPTCRLCINSIGGKCIVCCKLISGITRLVTKPQIHPSRDHPLASSREDLNVCGLVFM